MASIIRNAGATRRAMAVFSLTIHLAGCSYWVPVSQPIPDAVAKHADGTVRLTLADGRKLEVSEPRIAADTLYGLHTTASSPSGVPEPWDTQDTVAVALREITRLEVEKGSGSMPAIIAGAALLVVVVAVAVSQALDDSHMGF